MTESNDHRSSNLQNLKNIQTAYSFVCEYSGADKGANFKMN